MTKGAGSLAAERWLQTVASVVAILAADVLYRVAFRSRLRRSIGI
jgi:hypothetical protein